MFVELQEVLFRDYLFIDVQLKNISHIYKLKCNTI